MNTEEARFVLRAYRSTDDRSGSDPLFQEALAQAHRDPQLLKWLATEQAFDAAVSTKIEAVPLPPGLRESILIGARASRPRRNWWSSPTFLAVAAAVVAVVGLSLWFQPVDKDGVAIASVAAMPEALAQFALDNLTHGPHSHDATADAARLGEALATHRGPIALATDLDLSESAFRRAGCQSFDFSGRRVFEVCFRREGRWYHLYVTAGPGAREQAPGSEGGRPSLVFLERGQLAAAAWESAGQVYTLATSAGRDALQTLL